MIDRLVLLGALATALVGGWLVAVSVTMLPTRDPEHALFWFAIGLGMIGYAGFSALLTRPGSPAGRAALPLSAIAVAAGVVICLPAFTSGDFEGYLVLIGGMLAGQGLVILLRTAQIGLSSQR